MKKNLFTLFTFMLLTLLFAHPVHAKEIHPYHVGSVEFKYNSASRTFEISGKFYLEDLENALKEKYGKAVHFGDDRHKNELDALLIKYCDEYLKLKADNRFLKITYLGFEEDSESVHIYLESEKVNTPKKVETAVSFLYNVFEEQMNIITIIVGGNRKSHKLNYPNRYLYQNF